MLNIKKETDMKDLHKYIYIYIYTIIKSDFAIELCQDYFQSIIFLHSVFVCLDSYIFLSLDKFQ